MQEGNKENPIKLDEVVITPRFSFDFEGARVELFPDGFSQLQLDSIKAVIREADAQGVESTQQLSYILATAFHEAFDYDGKTTGRVQRFVPIREKGGDAYLKKKPYWPYVGMGFCQITWRENYIKFQPLIKSKFGVDILVDPKQLLRIDIAAFVIVYGMVNGTFTGKKLSDYINGKNVDYYQARRIVNILDKAATIEQYAKDFEKHIN